MSKQNSFEIFGNPKFQTRILQGVLTDYKFYETIFELLKKEYFTTTAHQIIWEFISQFFEKYNSLPTYDTINAEISSLTNDTDREATKRLLFDIKKETNSSELQFAKDKAFEFCRNKIMEGAIIKSVKYLENNNFDAIQKEIEESMRVTLQVDNGHDYFNDFALRSKENMRKPVPTGFKSLDDLDVLNGGLAAGELGIIMAPTGGGKSFFLVNLGYGALKNGYDVVHYTFELSETHIGWRYDARISQVPIRDITVKPDDVEKKLKEFKGGRLIIKEYPVKSATVNHIKTHIGRLKSSGYNPGLIIIDYLDLMRSRRGYEQKRFELECIYEDVRSLSQELKIPVWSASQTNRGGYGDEIITIDKIGEGYVKAQIADFVASFSRTMDEKQRGLGKFFIAKNRFGEDGFWLPTSINTAKAYINIGKKMSEIEEEDDIMKMLNKSMNNDSPLMNELYKKHKDRRQ